jgi:hypothetical protein
MDDPSYREKMRVLCQLYTNFSPNSTCTFYDTLLRPPTIIYELLHKQPARTGTCIHLRYQVHVRNVCSFIHNNQPTLLLHASFFACMISGMEMVTFKKKGIRQKENNTWDSNVVPHRSTNQARTCLTSLSGREAVLSCWYGRSQNVVLSQPLLTIIFLTNFSKRQI